MNKEWIEKGYIDEPVEASVDLKKEIRRLCREKDAVLLAHYTRWATYRKWPTSLATHWPLPARQHRPMPR